MPPFELKPGDNPVREMWRPADAASNSDTGAGGAGLGDVEQGGSGSGDDAGGDDA